MFKEILSSDKKIYKVKIRAETPMEIENKKSSRSVTKSLSPATY